MARLIPSRLLIGLLLLGVVPLLGGVYLAPLTWLGLGFDGMLLVVAALDWFASRGSGQLELERRVGPMLSIGVENGLGLMVRSQASTPLVVRLRESLPASFEPDRVALEVALGPRGEALSSYSVRPTRRGEYAFAPVTVRVRSRLGLLWRQTEIDLEGRVRVYPDVNALRQFDLAARRDRMAEMGLRRVRWIGTGTEFESLREYSPDDDSRAIDWKATARRGRAITRQHQLERSQPIMLMIDAGRLMTREFGGLSRLDHAINAALLLGYVAMGRGDRVGLLTFGEKLERFIPPLSGQSILPTLMAGVFDLMPTLKEADYAGAFQTLALRNQKRSLVVVFTEVSSSEGSEQLLGYLGSLAPRHIGLVVCIRDTDLQRRADQVAGHERAVLEKAAAITLVEEREAALRQLEQRGALVIDVAPGELNLAVVNRYLELKARGRL